MCQIYVQKTPKVEGIQFDGKNGEAIVEFVGGADFGKVSGDELILTPSGKDPRGGKITVSRGQFVVKSVGAGISVVNEGDFAGAFENEDGTPIAGLPPAELPPPVAEDELVYEPGFRPLTEEEKKKTPEPKAKEEPHRVFGRK